MKPSPRTLTPSEELLVAGGLLVQPFLAAVLAFALFPRLLLDRQGHHPEIADRIASLTELPGRIR